jgi:hypothetical protein
MKHLADTVQKLCNLSINSDNAHQDLSKQQEIEIVEIVEKELLGHPARKPVLELNFYNYYYRTFFSLKMLHACLLNSNSPRLHFK